MCCIQWCMHIESIAEFVAIPIGRGCGDGDILYGNSRGDGGGYGDGLANGDNERCDNGTGTGNGYGYCYGNSSGDGTGCGFDTELSQP